MGGDYYKKSETYTKAQIDALVDNSAGKTRELKSITTQPTGTFVYGDLYYNSSTKELYYYTGSTWELTGHEEPIPGVIYSFNGVLYFWDEAKVDLVQIGGGVDLSNYYTKTEIDERLTIISGLLLRLFNNDLTVKELTISEIEKLLGYKVKIVKADSGA